MKRNLIKKALTIWLTLVVCISVATAQEYKKTVAKDGSGDYTSIQAAIDATKSYPYERRVIYIKDGVYKEKVKVHAWNSKLTLVGESKDSTIITYDDHFKKISRGRNSTFMTQTLKVEANDVHVENLTVRNTAGPVGQALALHVDADRVTFNNCRFLGHQDTQFLTGEGARQYFKDCYIEGTTDFIFGQATAVFEDCTIHSTDDSYITAASTPQDEPFGFVFKDCRLTAEDSVKQVYLGRPWRKYAQTVFMNCYMGDHVRSEGWHNWGKPAKEKTTFYAEYNNEGPGFKPEKRVKWSHQIGKKTSKKYTLDNIFDGWDPSERYD